MVGKILPYTSHVLVCSTGELRPGLYGWMSENAEVLELLAFWKLEQQAAYCFRIWRPLHDQISKDLLKQIIKKFLHNIHKKCIIIKCQKRKRLYLYKKKIIIRRDFCKSMI